MKKSSVIRYILGVVIGVAFAGMTVCAEEDSRPAPSTNIVEYYDNRIMYEVDPPTPHDSYPVYCVLDGAGKEGWGTTAHCKSPNIGLRVIGITDSGYYVTEGWCYENRKKIGELFGKQHYYKYYPQNVLSDTPMAGYQPISTAEIETKLAEIRARLPEGSLWSPERSAVSFRMFVERYIFGEEPDPNANPNGRQSGRHSDVYNIKLGDEIVVLAYNNWGGIVTGVYGDYITVLEAERVGSSQKYEDGPWTNDYIIHWDVKYDIEELKYRGVVVDTRY